MIKIFQYFIKLSFVSLVFLMAEARAEIARLPIFADGIQLDPKAKVEGHFLVYDIKGVLRSQEISARYTKNSTIEELTASIIHAYMSNDPAKYKSFYTANGLKRTMAVGEEKFNQLWQLFRPQKGYVLSTYFYYDKGVFATWGSKENPVLGMFYAVKTGKRWSLEYLDIKPEDASFHNILAYLGQRTFEFKEATIIKDFKRTDSEYSIAAQVELPILHVMRKQEGQWQTMAWATDNQTQNVQHKDLETAAGLVKVKLTKEDIPAGKDQELLIFQSNFVVRQMPAGVFPKGQIKL